MFYSSRFSLLQGSTLENYRFLPARLSSLQAVPYIWKLLISFGETSIFSLACIFAGAWAIFWIQLNDKSISHGNYQVSISVLILTSFLIGHWILSSTFLILAKYGELTQSLVTWTLIAGFIIGVYPFAKMLIPKLKDKEHRASERVKGKFYRAIQWLSISVLIFALMYSTARLSYDSVALYFSDAKLTALTNHIELFRPYSSAASSFQTTIQFSALIQIFGDQAARMFSWACGLVVILFSLELAKKLRISTQAKIILLVLMLTSTAFTDLLGDGKVDLASTAPSIAAIYWLIANEDKTSKLLVGFLVGLSMASRPYNIFLFGIFILSLYLFRISFFNVKSVEKRGTNYLVTSIAWIGVGAIPPLIFHLIANWMVSGNPLAFLALADNLNSSRWQWSFNVEYIWIMRLFYPVVITFLNTSQSLGNISPLFIVFLPSVFLRSVRRKIYLPRKLAELLAATIVTLVLWITLFFTILEIRYIFFLWLILFVISSEVIVVVLEDKNSTINKILSGLIIFLLIFSISRVIFFSLDAYSPLNEKGDPECSHFYFCDYLGSINKSASEGSRTLTLTAYRYYLRSDLFACSTKGDEYITLRDASEAGTNNFWNEVYRQGYSYVAYENNYSVRHLSIDLIPKPTNVPNWMKLEPIYGTPEDETTAYKIIVTSKPPIGVKKTCVQENNVWAVKDIVTQ